MTNFMDNTAVVTILYYWALVILCGAVFITGAVAMVKEIIHKVEKAIPYITKKIHTKEYMLTKKPKKYESMTTGLVLYNTVTEKFLSVESEWNGHDGYEAVYLWKDSTPCRVFDQNGHWQQSASKWKEMLRAIIQEIPSCLLVPAEIFTKHTFFGKYQGYFMSPDFLHAYKFQEKIDTQLFEELEGEDNGEG